jgi:DNA uptake protein ComE-like DNA-binding protein
MENEKELFDLAKPVKLIRTFISRRRNKYGPAIYDPNKLPKEAYTTYYCEPNAGANNLSTAAKPTPPKPTVTRDENDNVTINPNTSNSIEDVEIKAERNKDATPTKPININEANREQLEGLTGIGKTVAKKVLDLRENSPFIDYADLNVRIPLPFGGKWSSYELTFSEDN